MSLNFRATYDITGQDKKTAQSQALFEQAEESRAKGRKTQAVNLYAKCLEVSFHYLACAVLREHYGFHCVTAKDEHGNEIKSPENCYGLSLYYGSQTNKANRCVPNTQEGKMNAFHKTQTLHWLKTASEKGHARALRNMGLVYLHGWFGVPQSRDMALDYMMKSSGLKEGLDSTVNPWNS